MKQSPRYFFGYLTKKLEAQGLIPSKHDPCLFLGNGLLVMTYVDDILIYGRTQEEINDLIAQPKKDNISLPKKKQLKDILVSKWFTMGTRLSSLNLDLPSEL